MKKTLTIIAFAATLFLICRPLQAEQNCGEILERNCTSCHYKDRICKKVGTKNRRSWKNTTKRMIRYGLKIAKRDIDTITECLVDLEDGESGFCRPGK